MHTLNADRLCKPDSSTLFRFGARAFFVIIAVLFVFSPARRSVAAESSDSLETRIQSSQDPAEQARRHKERGDQLVSQDQVHAAADEFAQALEIGRDSFSAPERVQMAVYLAWADRLRDSERELRAVLAQDPKNIPARTQLARVLSWRGELTEAIEEADKVLAESPENREALIIKADALRWKDRIHEALPIYKKLIARDGDFDAQVGLAHSMLALGNRTAAIETARPLKPASFSEKREFDKLVDTIERDTNPRLDARYLYYKDSDDNQVNRYSLSYGLWIGNWNLAAGFRHVDASDESRSNRAEDVLFSAYSNLTDDVRAGIGLGFNQLGNGRTTTFPTGQFRIDARVLSGTAGISVGREVLSDTAELIDNRIRATSAGWYLSQALTDRLTIKPGYAYRDFSDHNHSHDIQFNTEYALYFDPKLVIAHRFRFLDFGRQSGSGLFDPDNYYSNRGVVSLYMQRPNYYAYAEVFVGQQAFRRNDRSTSEFVSGGASSLGITPTRHWTMEIYGEGGNFAAGSAAGFTYFNVGPRLIYRF
jgi:tetratricopeptide (TPR) repeat protein